MHGIYKITINDRCYIGQSANPKQRLGHHLFDLRNENHDNQHLQNAFNKHGEVAMSFEVLESNIAKADIDEREAFWIAHFDSFHNGYNKTPGGYLGRCPGKPCEWNGVIYESISEAARALGISLGAMENRVRRGYTQDEQVTHFQSSAKPCIWNGTTYDSMTLAAKANGISAGAMIARIKRGLSSDHDVRNYKRMGK